MGRFSGRQEVGGWLPDPHRASEQLNLLLLICDDITAHVAPWACLWLVNGHSTSSLTLVFVAGPQVISHDGKGIIPVREVKGVDIVIYAQCGEQLRVGQQ